MFYDGESVCAERTDQCYRCKHIQNCPLVHAIAEGMVLLAFEDIKVKNCGLYDGPQRFKVVKDE